MAGSDILSRIQVLLDADTANFSEGMQKAKGESKSTFESIRENANKMGTAVAAGAGTALVALSAMAWETANHAAELEKYALRSNTTTQEFQKMAVGAQAYGVEQEALSDMMKDFNEKLGELTTIGAGGGVDFFEQIAVKTEGSAAAAEKLILKMQKLSGPEALQLYVDKLEEAGVTQQQMSFYLESMASDMTDLYPLLANGGEGMKYYADMAERFGVIMADETLESAALLKDQIYSLDLQMQGAKNQLVQAVIPAFVDIASAFFSSSDQGLQFTEVASGIAKGLKVLASIAIGAVTAIQLVGKALGGMAAIGGAIWNETDWYEMNPIGLVKAAYEARTEIAALTTEMKADMHSTVMGAASRMDKMWSGAAAEEAKKLRGFRELELTNKGVNKGLGELAEKQDKAAQASSRHSKAIKEQNRLLEEQLRDREQISKAYASDFQNLVWDEAEELKRIEKAGFSAAEQEKYLGLVKQRFDAESAEYFKNLNLELNQYKWTEEKKLQYAYEMDREIAANDVKIADEVREAKLKFLDEQYAYQKKQMELNSAKELLQVKKLWMDASDYAEQYYALIREEILNTASYSPEMKDTLIKQANIQQGVEQNAEREDVWSDYQNMMGIEQSPYQQDIDLLAKAREQMLITEEEYQQQRLAMQLAYGSQYGADFAGMMMGLVDSSSSAYAMLAGIQKGAALFSTAMNSFTAISAAWASAPFPYNLPAVGMTVMETGLLQSAVSALSPVGMAHDGIDNIPQEGTWLLDGGERVLNSKQNEDMTKYLANKQTTPAKQAAQNLQINNILDPSIVGDFMGTSSGTKTFMNFIKNNRSSIKAMIA